MITSPSGQYGQLTPVQNSITGFRWVWPNTGLINANPNRNRRKRADAGKRLLALKDLLIIHPINFVQQLNFVYL
jgi:hypothetical protein